MKYRNHSITNVGKVRSANEDNYGDALTPNGHLFVVCDGMGGHVGGAKASSIAVSSITEYFMREQYSNVIQAIDRALSFANEQIFANALSVPDLKGMGTTAVILLISGNDCFVGHVGDSRIYLKSSNKLNRITKDHSFVQTLVDSGIISDDEAESHPKKNQILKALGTSSVVEGTISQMPIQVKNGDVFLLCSDGLNGMVNDKGLEIMLQGNNLVQAGNDLIRAALDAGGLDNVTATIVAIDDNVYSQSNFVDFNPIKKFDAATTQNYSSAPFSSAKKGGISPSKALILIGLFSVLIGVAYYVFFSEDKDAKKGSPTTKEQVDTKKTKEQGAAQKTKEKLNPSKEENGTTKKEEEQKSTSPKEDKQKSLKNPVSVGEAPTKNEKNKANTPDVKVKPADKDTIKSGKK